MRFRERSFAFMNRIQRLIDFKAMPLLAVAAVATTLASAQEPKRQDPAADYKHYMGQCSRARKAGDMANPSSDDDRAA